MLCNAGIKTKNKLVHEASSEMKGFSQNIQLLKFSVKEAKKTKPVWKPVAFCVETNVVI